MEFIFRKCCEDDLTTLRDLSISTFIDTYGHLNKQENIDRHLDRAFNKERLLYELNDPNVHYHFLCSDDKVIGFIKLNCLDSQTEVVPEENIELERIYLLNEYKGKGLGRKLIEKAIVVCQELHYKKLWLGVWKKNPNAVLFYERMGFMKSGEHIFKVGDEEQVDWVMEINIKN